MAHVSGQASFTAEGRAMAATIPRFLVCAGDAESAVDTSGQFIAFDVDIKGGGTRHGLLMFSTSDKAREFIASNPGEWHVRCLDAVLLSAVLDDAWGRSQIDCIAIDFMNNGRPAFVRCFDTNAAADLLRNWVGEPGEMPSVETWQVFM